MKLGDMIKCSGEKDVRQMLKDLDAAGFHAVVMDYNMNWIRITSVPETEYMVAAHNQHGMQNNYCQTLEEAEELAEEMARYYEFVEILKGYPGEWEVVNG